MDLPMFFCDLLGSLSVSIPELRRRDKVSQHFAIVTKNM